MLCLSVIAFEFFFNFLIFRYWHNKQPAVRQWPSYHGVSLNFFVSAYAQNFFVDIFKNRDLCRG